MEESEVSEREENITDESPGNLNSGEESDGSDVCRPNKRKRVYLSSDDDWPKRAKIEESDQPPKVDDSLTNRLKKVDDVLTNSKWIQSKVEGYEKEFS